ncbi:hypothetical protein AAC387_Pa11g0700 [Persea americana]
MIRLARGKPVSESLLSVRLRIRRFWDVEMGQSSVKLPPSLRKKAFDFGVSRDSTRPYVRSHFAMQLGFSQGLLERLRFVESLSVYRGLSKKELNVKQSSEKGLGKSDAVRKKKVMAFLSGEKHITGFLEDQDVIRSGTAQEIPGEVLEQLAEEETEVAAWIQAEQAKASMESTGKRRPSSEDSGERPDFDGGTGTSSNSSHRSKRRRGQRRSKRRDENSPDLEIPSTMLRRHQGMTMSLQRRGAEEKRTIVMVPANEAVTDLIMASEEEPRDSEVDLEFPLADLPEDSDDFEPSMDATFDDASDELMEAESIPPVVEEGHLEAGFGMVKHVQDILADSEEVGLDITDAKAFVDEVIALGNKWIETKSFPNGDFFSEMFLKPSSEVKSELNEILRTRKQLVRERNVTELAIIELTQDQHRLDREVIEARQRLELLEEQAAAKWTAILKARERERTLIRQVKEVESNLRRKT